MANPVTPFEFEALAATTSRVSNRRSIAATKKSAEDAAAFSVHDVSEDEASGDVQESGLLRGLKGRHIVFIALGSIIGPGTFYGLGYAMVLSGPLGGVLGFGLTGILVWFLMQGLGEVTTMFPIRGGWVEHAGRFVDPAFSFATTWLYYLMWGFFLGSEFNAATLILQFWVPTTTVPTWAWCLIFWGILNVITLLGVRVYGEIEYCLSMFKFVATIVIFICCILANTGAWGQGYVGFRYWQAPYGPFLNGVNGFGQVFVLAANYYVGTELISINAGEAKNPVRDIPRGVNSVVYRICVVYIGLCFFQAMVCPSTSPDLLSATSTTASSPFTIGFALAGWDTAGHFINAVIMVTFISAANGCVYVMSRSLHSMAVTGRAPKFFGVTTKGGIPFRAIVFSNLFGFTMLMNLSINAGTVFSYFNSVCGTSAFIAWSAMMFTHLRMRAGAKANGIDPSTFPFKAFGPIWMYYIAFGVMIFLLLIQGFTAFLTPFNYKDFITMYITLPTWFILFFGYKWYHKTHWVRASEMDFSDANRKEEDTEMEKSKSKSFKSTLLSILKD